MEMHHPFDQPPPPGSWQQVAPGLFWLRLALPFALDHVNLWALEDEGGWTLVDTGVDDEDGKERWRALVADRPVRRLICTHFHPDHMGLAGWMEAHWGAPLWTSLGEWLFGRMLWLDQGPDYVQTQLGFYRAAGYDAALLEGIAQRGNSFRARVGAIPGQVRPLADGEEIVIGGRRWRVMIGRGHAPEHVCLYAPDERLLIAGDQILPRISPIVGVWPQSPDADPLTEFLDSLAMLKTLPADTLVLPSHGLPFVGLHGRADDLAAHHGQRLDRAVEACAEPATALQVARILFARRTLDGQQTGYATGETIAHLNRAWRQGRLERRTGADGVWLYKKT